MMGQAAGGSIFRMVLVAHETKALLSKPWRMFREHFQDSSASGIRFVDDLRVFVIFPLSLGEAWAKKRAKEFLQFVYPPHLLLKDDAVNPFVGLRLQIIHNELHWSAHHKPIGDSVAYGKTYQQALLPWRSFSPPATFDAVLLGGFSRCKQLSSNVVCMTHSLRQFRDTMIVQAGYPEDLVHRKLKAWIKAEFHDLRIFHACLKSPAQLLRPDCRSFTEAGQLWPIGRLHLPSL